jgi:hypothetical protein
MMNESALFLSMELPARTKRHPRIVSFHGWLVLAGISALVGAVAGFVV